MLKAQAASQLKSDVVIKNSLPPARHGLNAKYPMYKLDIELHVNAAELVSTLTLNGSIDNLSTF